MTYKIPPILSDSFFHLTDDLLRKFRCGGFSSQILRPAVRVNQHMADAVLHYGSLMFIAEIAQHEGAKDSGAD